MENEFIIYNLEFPEYFNEISIGDYVIKRLPEYNESHKQMMWTVNYYGGELSTEWRNGSHQATASVTEINHSSDLAWRYTNTTKLDDICLILSIFSGRHVFAISKAKHDSNPLLVADHRTFNYGGILKCSLPYEEEFFKEDTLETLTPEEIENDEYYYVNRRDRGFITGINNILNLIESEDWKSKYADGYFLIFFEKALYRMDIEIQFLLCWIIWEHLFAVLKKNEYTEDQLENDIDGKFKIIFLLTTYFPMVLNANSRREIDRIKNARNKLVHLGQKPNDVDYEEMDLFIRATEYLICKTLNLTPSNLFNTDEKLARFLRLRN